MLATTIEKARAAVQAVDDADDLGLKQRVAALQKEMEEVAAAKVATKAELKVPFGSVTDRQPGLIGPICCG